MRSIILITILLFFFHGCGGCRNLTKSQIADFEITCGVEERSLHLWDHKKVRLSMYIVPKNEVAKKLPYYQLLNWKILGGLRGDLMGVEGEKVNLDTKLRNGENIFFYKPEEIGPHTIVLQVTDKYQNPQKEAIFPSIVVEKKATQFFKVVLTAIAKNLSNNQTNPITLDINSKDVEAKELAYIVKRVEVNEGRLEFENGKEVEIGSKLIFGIQKLIFKSSGQAGTSKIKLTVSNGTTESTADLTLDIKPLSLRLELEGMSKHIFTYQTAPIDLIISSKEEWGKESAYVVKQIEINKGELQFEDSGKKVESGSYVKYGTQRLVFVPTGEIGQAKIGLTIMNRQTGSEGCGSLVLEVKPPSFKCSIWLKEPTEVDKNLISGDFGILQIMISGIDKELAKESWKITEYKFSDGIQGSIVDQELKHLAEFSLKVGVNNKFYLNLPDIKLNKKPTLTIKVEGPGKAIQETVVELYLLQKALIAKKKKQFLEVAQKQAREIYDGLRLPVSSGSYAKVKELSRKSAKQIAAFKEVLAGIQSSYAALGRQEQELEKMAQEVRTLELKYANLVALKKECKKKKSSFKAELKTNSRSVFNHNNTPIDLVLSSEEGLAGELMYSVKELDVLNGDLQFDNGDKVKVDSKLIFGTQKLVFRPIIQSGVSRVNLTVKNNQNSESNTELVLEVKPVAFKAELQVAKSITNHKNFKLPLIISSEAEEAQGLAYVVKRLEVTNGSIEFENGEKLKLGTNLIFGTQNLIFEPTEGPVQAEVKLTISNNTGSDSSTEVALKVEPPTFKDLKPVAFKADLQVSSTTIFNQKNINLFLILSSDEEQAREVPYTIKELEVTNGSIEFENGEEIQVGTNLIFGHHNLIFNPTGEVGQAKVKLTVSNNTGSECSTGVILEVRPLAFKAELQASPSTIMFNHKPVKINLVITSDDERADMLTYTVKKLEVSNGELHFGLGRSEVKPNSKVRYGWQTLIFKPAEDIKGRDVKATIKITISNGKGSECIASLVLSVKSSPIYHFP